MADTKAEKPCTVLISYEESEPPQLIEIKKQLEAGSPQDKIDTMKRVILLMLNGENMAQLLMPIIRFVMTLDDKKLKKLVLLFLEIVEKTTADGKLLPEMILVCNALRNDLIHPNEYVRGSTLRFLSKLKEPEILEPLLPSIRQNLEYKHTYARRNAVLALYNVYKNFDYLCPDAPELIYNFLVNEGDASCKRNAFIMLFNCAQDKAVQYLSETLDQVAGMGEIIQLIVVELIRRVCRTNPTDRSKYIKCIFTLLSSTSSAVQYEAAGTLVSLSSAPTAVKAAASTYIELLVKESDNNVKMIVLDRLLPIKTKHTKILQDLLMDILRALSSPNMDIRKKTLELALDLVSPKNIEEVIVLLKREIQKTQSKELDKAGEYRQMLIQTIHSCAIKFPDVAANVVHLLMDFLGDSVGGSAVDVILFVREVMETYPDYRHNLLAKLLESLNQIRSSKVFRTALWICGEYAAAPEEIDSVFTTLRELTGDLPFFVEDDEEEKKQESTPTNTNTTPAPKPQPAPATKARVLADGSYATQSALTSEPEISSKGTSSGSSVPHLRALILGGDWFLAAVLGYSLTKLALKAQQQDMEQITKNMIVVDVLTLLTGLARYGQSKVPANPIDPDSQERLYQCIKVLTEPDPLTRDLIISDCRISFAAMIAEQARSKPLEKTKKEVEVQVDDLIKVRQIRGRKAHGADDADDFDDSDMSKATGTQDTQEDLSLRLNRVYQLTGFSDPIYAEAYINVHQYDIVYDVVVINQTGETLQNVALELATLGDLKLVERPQTHTIGPHDKKMIKANIKVSSTETGIIFGNIVYDIAGVTSSDRNCVILNDIHIDIMDYISPATCSELKFRSMWAEFEWENKVVVNSNITDVNEFLKHIIQSTNMKCLTTESALAGECGFLSANLYARSVFGEDALANLSIEKQADGKIGGYIRIRSKTQGIALSLGDKITLKQRVATTGKA